ncbi:hypothetical protein BGX38DRAFT_893005 [Terfezia claveryi]|nr:hypothetical protein BGX38DRAFT_893005 [Terfezia claveryi]
MGRRLCAGLAGRLEGDAKKWWQDYDSKGDSDSPNCWRKHEDMKKPILDGRGNIEEVSLYELLKKQFSREVDARAAEIELGRYHWDPFKRGGSTESVTAFRTHIERLMKRAKKTDEFNRMRCIRNALPTNIKMKTEIRESEEELWKCIRRIHTTMEVDDLDKGVAAVSLGACTHCGKQGHLADMCRKKKEEKGDAAKKDINACNRCGRQRHFANTCFSKKHKDGSALPESTAAKQQQPLQQQKPAEAEAV